MVRKRTPEEQQKWASDAARILPMRKDRMRWSDIAVEMQLSQRRCQEIYKQALTEFPSQMADEYRTEELDLADDAVHGLLSIAKGDPTVRTKVMKDGSIQQYEIWPSFKDQIEAWAAIGRWSEHKAKIVGIYAPIQIQFTPEAIQQEIDNLMKQIEIMEAKELEASQGE
jgi:hypothetical protein